MGDGAVGGWDPYAAVARDGGACGKPVASLWQAGHGSRGIKQWHKVALDLGDPSPTGGLARPRYTEHQVKLIRSPQALIST